MMGDTNRMGIHLCLCIVNMVHMVKGYMDLDNNLLVVVLVQVE
jgi:hypothetical protein